MDPFNAHRNLMMLTPNQRIAHQMAQGIKTHLETIQDSSGMFNLRKMEEVTSSIVMNQEDGTWLLNSLEHKSIEEK